jgi:hypothetical protein
MDDAVEDRPLGVSGLICARGHGSARQRTVCRARVRWPVGAPIRTAPANRNST